MRSSYFVEMSQKINQKTFHTIQWCQNRGPFNNYVDQILPNFDPEPPRVDICHTPLFVYMDKRWKKAPLPQKDQDEPHFN